MNRVVKICFAFALLVSGSATADVVFDGSVGPLPAGTTRSGSFVIREADGQLSASNLFHSFEQLSVNSGESAVFSHTTPGVQNIIGRVSGDATTQISGSVAVRQNVDGTNAATAASLWLINPNGLIISDGAFFDTIGSVRLSSANEINFDNGDSYFSHDVTQTSTLSVANPSAFGFLAGDALPASIVPGGIQVRQSDPLDTNAPLFLADAILVGTDVSPDQPGLLVQGDLTMPFDPSAPVAPTDVAQIQAFRLGLHSLVSGEVLDLSEPAGTASGSVQIRNSNILVTDAGLFPFGSEFRVSGGSLQIDDSFVQTQSGIGTADIVFDATDTVRFANSGVQTTSFSLSEAGSLRITGDSLIADNSLLGSQIPDFGVTLGDAGDVMLTAGTGGLNLSDTFVIGVSLAGSAGGTIELRSAGDISIAGSQSARAQVSSSSGQDNVDAGQVSLSAAASLNLEDVQVSSVSPGGGAAGDITLSGSDIALANTDLVTTTFSSDPEIAPAMIVLRASGDLQINGGLLQSNTGGSAPAGLVAVEAGGAVTLTQAIVQSASASSATGNSGDVALVAGGTLRVQGSSTEILTNADGAGDAGSVSLLGANVDLLDGYTIQSTATGAGDAGTIRIEGGQIFTNTGMIGTSSANGGGGDINLAGQQITLFGQADSPVVFAANSSSSDSDGNGGSITLGAVQNPAELVVLRRSGLAANAAQGDGGRININSDEFVRDSRTVLSVSSQTGDPGALEINAPQQDISASIVELDVPLLDQTDLIQNVCDRQKDERSSLYVEPTSQNQPAPDKYFVTPVDDSGVGGSDAASGCAL